MDQVTAHDFIALKKQIEAMLLRLKDHPRHGQHEAEMQALLDAMQRLRTVLLGQG
jgi:hypothetical protein